MAGKRRTREIGAAFKAHNAARARLDLPPHSDAQYQAELPADSAFKKRARAPGSALPLNDAGGGG